MQYAGEQAMESGLGVVREPDECSGSSFDAIFLRHYGTIAGLLYRMLGDRSRAEELASEAFLKLFRQPASGSAYENAGGWLYRAAMRLGIDDLRSARRRKAYEPAAAEGLAAPRESPLDELLREERARLVRAALARLKPRQTEILMLRAEGLSYRELASTLGIHLASVGRMLARAEETFEKAYRRQERSAAR